jgi:hypothetical protein
MIIISGPVSLTDLKAMAQGGELHADEEALLLENGSQQKNLWGINIRPSKGNRSRGVDNMEIREKIIQVVQNLIST